MSQDLDLDLNDENDGVELELDVEKTTQELETKEVAELKQKLERMIEPLVAPPMFPPHPVKCAEPHNYPESYRSNSRKEELVLEYVENFQKQFQFIYPDRKPLFMAPYNECGIAKFVCTTIRPTILKHSKLYDWKDAAQFVSDYLEFQMLENLTEIPIKLWSPTHVLSTQKGNSFDFATLLCSLLVGAGYDAYVVSGYATREVTQMDQSRRACPLLAKPAETRAEQKRSEMGKYTAKAPRDFNSKYKAFMENKERRKMEQEAERKRREEEARIAEAEKPPPDQLYGLRVHAWVLVLSGKREVPETFFIEALTGQATSTSDEEYLGIESVWNHKNYWVNMQSCIDGTASMIFDLGDSSKWEYMLPSNDKPILKVPNLIDANDDDEEDPKEIEKHLDLPPSWVKPIEITPKEFERRCPEGKKVIFFKKCKVEKFAPYLLPDNMILKITEFLDNDMKQLKQITEEYFNRSDKIKRRVVDFTTGWEVETFDRGRSKFVKEHRYQMNKTGPENERVMFFYDEARVDGLKCREETPVEMVEHYVNRNDFLFYRKVVFDKRPKIFGPQEGENFRPILKIIERYDRNDALKANEDIFELIFNIEADKFQITYHRENSKIAPTTREFLKPPNWNDRGTTLAWNTEFHQTYKAGTEYKDKKNVELYEMLIKLIEREEKAKGLVRKSEAEVKSILSDRTHEKTVSELLYSIYDTERNSKAKQYQSDIEKKIAEEKLRKQTLEVDYLEPFLAEKGISGQQQVIPPQLAIELRERCLADLKQRLIDKANLIQNRFKAESNELQKKQQWYQANQINMSREDEQEYLEYCAEAMFRIHILELRLNRHREMAPEKYKQMDERLRTDPRLSAINNRH